MRLSKNLPHDWKEQRCFLGFAIKYEKAVECLTKDRDASLAKGLTFQRNDSAR
jgi:hypothetical protein